MSINNTNTKAALTEKDINFKEKVENKREVFRLNERMLIQVRIIQETAEYELTGETIAGRTGQVAEHFTEDISGCGLQFFSKLPYRDNMHVEIILFFKNTEPKFNPIIVNAKILRAEQVKNRQNYNVSVMFINLNPKDREQIEGYIFARQRQMIAERR